MTSVEISGEGVLGITRFPNAQQPSFTWDKSKNPFPLKNYTSTNLAIIRGPGTTWLVASWFLVPGGYRVGNYAIFQWVWVLAIQSHPITLQSTTSVMPACQHAWPAIVQLKFNCCNIRTGTLTFRLAPVLAHYTSSLRHNVIREIILSHFYS